MILFSTGRSFLENTMKPIQIRLNRLNAFSSIRTPTISWLLLSSGNPELLISTIQDREYTHLTKVFLTLLNFILVKLRDFDISFEKIVLLMDEELY